MLTIISGAFGIFRTDLVLLWGGYRSHAIGEDFDLVTRLHRHLMEKGADYRIEFVPDPVCWTEVPSDLRSLGRQRARWHKGLLDVLWPNKDMLFGRAMDGSDAWRFLTCGCRTSGSGHRTGWHATIVLAACLGVLNGHCVCSSSSSGMRLRR